MKIDINNQSQVKNLDNKLTLISYLINRSITIPHYCYHNDLSVAGNCRVCLIELKNSPKPGVSCDISAKSCLLNNKVYYDSVLLKKARENILEFLLLNHPVDCPIYDQGGECDLQKHSLFFGFTKKRFYKFKRVVSDKDLGPVVKTVMPRRIPDYPDAFYVFNKIASWGSEISGFSLVIFLGVLIEAFYQKKALDIFLYPKDFKDFINTLNKKNLNLEIHIYFELWDRLILDLVLIILVNFDILTLMWIHSQSYVWNLSQMNYLVLSGFFLIILSMFSYVCFIRISLYLGYKVLKKNPNFSSLVKCV